MDEALVEQLTEPLHCFATTENLAFTDSDRRHGSWRNYFVGVVGAVAADENDVLWPNQVLALAKSGIELYKCLLSCGRTANCLAVQGGAEACQWHRQLHQLADVKFGGNAGAAQRPCHVEPPQHGRFGEVLGGSDQRRHPRALREFT